MNRQSQNNKISIDKREKFHFDKDRRIQKFMIGRLQRVSKSSNVI